ncbi:RNA 2',3'-cyclic phosphodiesterase [Patescibacteria group bacterium]|nr:RNA 2',3'-cyclic phosphodiesterase [Patescibacteria group bacterium]
MQKHRIFIAINLPGEVKTTLSEHQRKIEDFFTQYRTEGSDTGPARWTKPENLHITAVFIGDVDDNEVGEIRSAVSKIAENFKSFSLILNKISYSPYKKETEVPRMIWALGERSEGFVNLKNDLEKELSQKIRFVPKDRRVSLHITLARIKEWEWRRIEPEERPEIEGIVDLNFQVSSIELMESVLKRGGPKYKILESYKLK